MREKKVGALPKQNCSIFPQKVWLELLRHLVQVKGQLTSSKPTVYFPLLGFHSKNGYNNIRLSYRSNSHNLDDWLCSVHKVQVSYANE